MTKRMDLNGWYKLRWQILARDSFTCQYCGKGAPDVQLEVDHKVSLADGGTDSLDNLVTSCWACNRGKSGLRQSIILRKQHREKYRQISLTKPAQRQLATFISENPGLTTIEIAARLGWKRDKTYSYLYRARESQLLTRKDHQWYPVTPLVAATGVRASGMA